MKSGMVRVVQNVKMSEFSGAFHRTAQLPGKDFKKFSNKKKKNRTHIKKIRLRNKKHQDLTFGIEK